LLQRKCHLGWEYTLKFERKHRGLLYEKPEKPDYGVAKACRVIMLFNYLGKVVEKVAANTIAEECERRRLLYDGQFGSRK